MAMVVEMILTMNQAQGVSPKKKNQFLILLIILFSTSDLMMEHLCVSFFVLSNCAFSVAGRSG